MKDKVVPNFIVIDDDPVSNNISRLYINRLFPNADIQTFTDPKEGLDYILLKFGEVSAESTTLFLDINMPFLNGWDVLDNFIRNKGMVKTKFRIYINTSSVSPQDKERAIKNPLVSGYIQKPLTMLKLKSTLSIDDKKG